MSRRQRRSRAISPKVRLQSLATAVIVKLALNIHQKVHFSAKLLIAGKRICGRNQQLGFFRRVDNASPFSSMRSQVTSRRNHAIPSNISPNEGIRAAFERSLNCTVVVEQHWLIHSNPASRVGVAVFLVASVHRQEGLNKIQTDSTPIDTSLSRRVLHIQAVGIKQSLIFLKKKKKTVKIFLPFCSTNLGKDSSTLWQNVRRDLEEGVSH